VGLHQRLLRANSHWTPASPTLLAEDQPKLVNPATGQIHSTQFHGTFSGARTSFGRVQPGGARR
jgi:hypothetical protein